MSDLTHAQRLLLDEWLGGWQVSADYSWPLQDTVVLRVESREGSSIVKASRTSHHIASEIWAHVELLGSFKDWVPGLIHASSVERILVTDYLPGDLVDGANAEWEPETYLQAGRRLRDLLVAGNVSDDYVERQIASARRSIVAARSLVQHDELSELEARLSSIPARSVTLSFTHGDYQPRNWLMDQGQLRVIDFGRAAQRHWTSDLVRLHSQQFVGRDDLKRAFFAGLGRTLSPDDVDVFHLERIQQAVGTVVWAHSIDDEAFEEQGRNMIRMILNER